MYLAAWVHIQTACCRQLQTGPRLLHHQMLYQEVVVLGLHKLALATFINLVAEQVRN